MKFYLIFNIKFSFVYIQILYVMILTAGTFHIHSVNNDYSEYSVPKNSVNFLFKVIYNNFKRLLEKKISFESKTRKKQKKNFCSISKSYKFLVKEKKMHLFCNGFFFTLFNSLYFIYYQQCY